MGRHHLVVYEPAEGRVSTRFNGLLYSLPARKLGKNGGRSSAGVVARGQTPRRLPTYHSEHVEVHGGTGRHRFY